MKGIIRFGNKKSIVKLTCEHNKILHVEFEKNTCGLEKAYYYNTDADTDGFGNSLMDYETFDKFYDENTQLINLIEEMINIFDLRNFTEDIKIKRSIDFYESQIRSLKKIDGNVSEGVRKAVDEYIKKHQQ